MEAYDVGAGQIGFQMVNGLDTWVDVEPALNNARYAQTPAGVEAVSFVEIYLATFASTTQTGNSADLRVYDELFRERSGLPNDHGETHVIDQLPPGTYHYKVAGTHMTSEQCHMGTITVLP